MIAAGVQHSLAVGTTGILYAAGNNLNGELGLGSATYYGNNTYVPVSGFTSTVAYISTSDSNSIALDTQGNLYTWGFFNLTGVGLSYNTPQVLSTEEPFTFVYAGVDITFAVLDTNGTLFGWGNNANKAISNLDNYARYLPVPINGLNGVNITKCDVGGDLNGNWHVICQDNDDNGWAWGTDNYGELGNNAVSFIPVSPPQNITIFNNETMQVISAGAVHNILVDPFGSVSAFGGNMFGQCGLPTAISLRRIPIDISQSNVIIDAAAGSYHSLYCTTNGTTFGFGDNTFGEAGYNNSIYLNNTNPIILTPTNYAVENIVNATNVYAGSRVSYALAIGGLYSWGDNTWGQLGQGQVPSSFVPGLVNFNASLGIIKLSSARYEDGGHTLLLTSGGQLYVWGKNDMGQLGLGDNIDRFEPTLLDLGELVLDVAAGRDYSIVITGTRNCINDCSGQGSCDQVVGVCNCYAGYFGDDCHLISCPDNCNAPLQGTCNGLTGECTCGSEFNGNGCQYRKCPNNCSNHGTCDRTKGECTCDAGYTSMPDCSVGSGASSVKATAIVVVSLVLSIVFLMF